MAGASAISLLSVYSSPVRKLEETSVPLPSILHHHRYSTNSTIYAKPKLSICHNKFYNSTGEEIDESCFEGDEMIGEEESEEDEDDTESSLDLLLRFLQSMFKKVSKRARKASRAVLPDVISPQLASFAVDGVLVLASFSVLKALLEVFCSIGGTVFVVILLLRVIWASISYFQSSGNNFNQTGPSYSRTQPIT